MHGQNHIKYKYRFRATGSIVDSKKKALNARGSEEKDCVKLVPDWRRNQVEPWRNWHAKQACLLHHEMRQNGYICIYTGQLRHRQ